MRIKRIKKKIKREINQMEAVFWLIIGMGVLSHMEEIINIVGGILIVVGISVVGYKFIRYLYLNIRWRNSEYNYFDIVKKVNKMNPREFEVFCANLFKELGYKANPTQASHDYGRDVIARKGNKTTYIECKHYRKHKDNGRYVGREICQKLIGSCMAFGVKKGIIINTGDYNKNAYEYAQRINRNGEFHLELWDMKDIIKAVDRIDKKKVGYVLNYLEG